MKLSFFGADREVTGSCHCLEADGMRVLIDCGMIQGRGDECNQAFAFEPDSIDCVILTHAHIDHSGRLPLLSKRGFRGAVYATAATCDLLQAMLRDSAHIQEQDAKWASKKGRRTGRAAVEPLYTLQDAEDCLKQLVPLGYGERARISDGIDFVFTDAGHLMGSSYVTLRARENGIQKTIVFSGDIGNTNQPIIRDPSYLTSADCVVMESTYGDRLHEAPDDITVALSKIIDGTLRKGGNVVIPAFAVGRAQELLYFIRDMKARRLVPSHPDFPVYLDSPLAARTTKIYSENLPCCADEQTRALMDAGINPIGFSGLHIIESEEESRRLNDDMTPKVIISSSGMCEAGRIRHHLKHNLWRKECAVCIVGFQAAGTLGRKLVDGVKQLRLLGEDIQVAAEVHNFRGMSGHADRDGLMAWIDSFAPKPERVFVVHGEARAMDAFTGALVDKGSSALAPRYEAAYDLLSGAMLSEGIDIVEAEPRAASPSAFTRLQAAGQRLLEVISSNKGGANRDLNGFAHDINELCRKWDR